jgi:hypothetical protein
MAKLFVLLGLVALFALAIAAPAAEAETKETPEVEKKDLDTAAGHIYGGYGGKEVLGLLRI